MSETVCRICGFESSGKELTNHIKRAHNLSSEKYCIEHIYGGNRPTCQACSSPTRYVAFSFKKYCKEHAGLAFKEGGSKGGSAPSWNKGKTSQEDSRIKASCGERNPFWGKKHTDESKRKISSSKTLNRDSLQERFSVRRSDFDILTPIEEYRSRQNQYLQFICRVCGELNLKTLQAFERGSLCQSCFPNTSSKAEIEVADWIKSLGFNVESCSRDIISPKELDIVVPEKRFSVEFNGLYWHSEFSPNGISKSSHLDKTESCLKSGWSLFHVFSDEWDEKKEIVKSMIEHRLGLSSFKLNARSCSIRKINTKERREFFTSSHISGDVNSSESWGLEYNGSIVAAVSVREPRQKKWKGLIEIARYATRPGYHIRGGLTRLMKRVEEFCISSKKIGIITYSDRRFGEGLGYERSGFKKVGDTGIDYWYTDGKRRFDRFIFRSRDGKTEKNLARDSGVARIFGCGSYIWLKELE